MGNQLAHLPTVELVIDNDRMELLRKTIANEAPPLEFELFVADCNRRGLDPFAKQIYLVPRNVKSKNGQWETKWTAQTSIDGYRLIADRTKLYAGSDEPVYDTETEKHPNKATVTVWKIVGGQRVPFSSSARWDEYCQTTKDGNPSGLWNKMPYVMLAKCAESAALRKAFPQELSGLYTNEEMQQADVAPPMAHAIPKYVEHSHDGMGIDGMMPNPDYLDDLESAGPDEIEATVMQQNRDRAMKRYFAILHERGITDDERKALQRIWPGVESAKDMTTEQIVKLTASIERNSNEQLREKIAQNAPDRASDAEAPETTTYNTFDPVQAAEMFTRDIQNASTWAAAQAAARMATDIQVSTPELERAKADAYNKFHPKQETVIDVEGGPVQ